jgi:hypothetical protein
MERRPSPSGCSRPPSRGSRPWCAPCDAVGRFERQGNRYASGTATGSCASAVAVLITTRRCFLRCAGSFLCVWIPAVHRAYASFVLDDRTTIRLSSGTCERAIGPSAPTHRRPRHSFRSASDMIPRQLANTAVRQLARVSRYRTPAATLSAQHRSIGNLVRLPSGGRRTCCVARPETGLVADQLAVDRLGRGGLVADQLAESRTAEVGSLQIGWQ